MSDPESKVKPLPILIGPKNAEAVSGFSWRWCRDTAAKLRVPFVGHGRKRAVRADLFLAALERDACSPSFQSETTEADPAEVVRGILRRAGGS